MSERILTGSTTEIRQSFVVAGSNPSSYEPREAGMTNDVPTWGRTSRCMIKYGYARFT